MKTVQILEDKNTMFRDDWIRPLHFASDSSPRVPEIETFSTYSGMPENNIRWVRLSDFLGPHWYGKTLGELHGGFAKMKQGTNYLTRFEVVRGELPPEHIWNFREEKSCKA